MHFTLKQLRYFDAALRCGSIARAAVELNISQSSITAAIDHMEQVAGVELVRRMPARGITATVAGAQLAGRVREVLEHARSFEVDLLSLSGDPAGTLRLACYAPTAPHVLPPLLRRIAGQYPSIRIEMKEGDMQTIYDLLQAGAVDIALTYRRSLPERHLFQPMFRAPPFALLSDNSPLAGKESVTLAELAPLPMILLDLPMTERYFLGLFEARGLRPNIVHTTKSSSVLRGLVAADFGYSVMNICGANDRDRIDGYVVVPIADTEDSPRFGAAYTQATQRSKIVQAVLEICAEIADQGELDRIVVKKVGL